MIKNDRIQVRIDPKTKADAAALFDSMGLTVSDAVTLFIRQSLISNGLPFTVDYNKINPNNRESTSQIR